MHAILKDYVNIGTYPQSYVNATDGVFAYAKEVLFLTLLWAEFEDAIKEGYGLRVIRYWKYIQGDKPQELFHQSSESTPTVQCSTVTKTT